MSEIPALREALRDTARRKVNRRLRRLMFTLVVPIAAAFLAFALVAAQPRTDETTVPPATPTPTAAPTDATLDDAERELAKVYGVFRRPARASDRPPKGMEGGLTDRMQIEWQRARRVAALGERAAYVVPILWDGQVGLCLYTRRAPGKPGGGGCGPFQPSTAMTKPVWNKTFYRPASVYALLLPDGVERVTVHFKGRTETYPAGENGFLYEGRFVRRFTWRDAAGKQHSARASI